MADCLVRSENNPAECDFTRKKPLRNGLQQALQNAAQELNLRYWDPTPYFCSEIAQCPAVIGSVVVYREKPHHR